MRLAALPNAMTRIRLSNLRAPVLSSLAAIAMAGTTAACGRTLKPLPPGQALTRAERAEAIRRASVWTPVDISSIDFRKGPDVEGGFEPDALVTCDYKETVMDGKSRKFTCETKPGEAIKVKYGERNAEVYGEVLSSRLLWGLGFYADRMSPVRVSCKGCPQDPFKLPKPIAGTPNMRSVSSTGRKNRFGRTAGNVSLSSKDRSRIISRIPKSARPAGRSSPGF